MQARLLEHRTGFNGLANVVNARGFGARVSGNPTKSEALKECETPALAKSRSILSASYALELLGVFVLGVALMQFIYLDPRGLPASELGAPGFDSFYHTKMAAMMPSVGLVHEFPWLRYVYFSQHNDGFISHHYGFHALLVPFVKISHWLTGDYLIGARLAISVFFGASLVFMQALLIAGRVPWRWLWIIVFLLLPPEFFGRHAYVRAISPSLMMMLAIVLFVFRERAILAGVATALYVHLYLGSVVYIPMIVAVYAFSCLLAPAGERRFPHHVVLWTMLGWLVGLRTYPYFDGALEFLHMQIFGTGLDPDIPVGMEWNSYGNVWQFAARSCGPLLAVWTVCVVLRLRIGKRLNERELTLVIVQFAFLVLTLKAKRFIEYWPPFCMLSAAYMIAPIMRPVADWLDPVAVRVGGVRPAILRFGIAVVSLSVVILAAGRVDFSGLEPFMREWQLWAAAGALLLAGPLLQTFGISGGIKSGLRRGVQLLGLAGLFVAAVILLVRVSGGQSQADPQLDVGIVGWVLVACVMVGACVWTAAKSCGELPLANTVIRWINASSTLTFGLAIVVLAVVLGADRVTARQREIYCGYNLGALRDAMSYLKSVSEPGDVVFTDDWDVFPAYFYYNSYNNYIVGLDPKFTHWREPELWERYVKLSRGQVPRDFDAHWTGVDGQEVSRRLHVELTDIRDYFNARYVMLDSDHKAMARKLADSPEFARLIYPKTDYAECRDALYLIFEVVEPQQAGHDNGDDNRSIVYLSDLEPESVTQGWGTLHLDRSVTDQPLQLHDGFHRRGLGTHAPSEIVFTVPRGCDVFEAEVGVSSASDGPGTVLASVWLDDVEAFTSPLLTRSGIASHVRVELDGASRLMLRADPTEDGERWDHVDWADAHFLCEGGEIKSTRILDRRSRSKESAGE